jgi:hypothetical protein
VTSFLSPVKLALADLEKQAGNGRGFGGSDGERNEAAEDADLAPKTERNGTAISGACPEENIDGLDGWFFEARSPELEFIR